MKLIYLYQNLKRDDCGALVEWKLVERSWQPSFYTYQALVAFWNQGAAGSLSVRNSGMTFFRVKYISRQDFVRSRLLWLSTIHRSIRSSSVNIRKDNKYNTLPPSSAVVMKSKNFCFLQPSGPLQACNETALTSIIILCISTIPIRVHEGVQTILRVFVTSDSVEETT